MIMSEKNKTEASVLYLVATPIGNLSDISARALKVLSDVDFIAAEDTRNTAKLLSCFDIKKELISYFEHNKRERGMQIISRLLAGESCALVTDAGMPAISDPGEDMVRLCAENGIKTVCIPGCCAAVTALALSALPTGRFCFEGFLSKDKKDRRERLDFLRGETRTMIFYESPHHLTKTLSEMRDAFGGDRKISLCRELTKINEEVFRSTVDGAISEFESREVRGEFVLVVDGAREARTADAPEMSIEDEVMLYTNEGMSKMDAIKRVAKNRGVPKNEIYNLFKND